MEEAQMLLTASDDIPDADNIRTAIKVYKINFHRYLTRYF